MRRCRRARPSCSNLAGDQPRFSTMMNTLALQHSAARHRPRRLVAAHSWRSKAATLPITASVAGSKRSIVLEAAASCRHAAPHAGVARLKVTTARSAAATAAATKPPPSCLPPPASSAQELMHDHLQSPESAAAHEPSQPPMPMSTMKQRMAVPMAAERAVSMLHCNICQLRHCCARRAPTTRAALHALHLATRPALCR
jgi:hypothetical protein